MSYIIKDFVELNHSLNMLLLLRILYYLTDSKVISFIIRNIKNLKIISLKHKFNF